MTEYYKLDRANVLPGVTAAYTRAHEAGEILVVSGSQFYFRFDGLVAKPSFLADWALTTQADYDSKAPR